MKTAIFTDNDITIYPLRGSICGSGFDRILVDAEILPGQDDVFINNIEQHLYDGGKIVYLDKYK